MSADNGKSMFAIPMHPLAARLESPYQSPFAWAMACQIEADHARIAGHSFRFPASDAAATAPVYAP